MRGIPAIKKASNLLDEVRKDLSKVNELQLLFNELDKVHGEDRADALVQQAFILSYLNQQELASEKFLESYKLSGSEISFGNYLTTLRNSGKVELSIKNGLGFLEDNLNNYFIFDSLASFLQNSYYPELLVELEKYKMYHIENDTLIQNLERAKDFNSSIEKVGLSRKLINKLLFIVEVEIRKIFFKQECNPTYHCFDNTFYYRIENLPEYEDIITLNKNYEIAIETAIENQEISMDEYIDSISKFVVGFKANPSKEAVMI